ncbi:MAG: class II aldolase [Chloroflexi bacterium]|nr:MAG: class II aldolase [Chloroflexota bacterium]
MDSSLQALVEMTRTLGEPHRDYVIIGEGNTSHRIDANSFWIKASGQQMHNIEADGFVAVRLDETLAIIDNPPPTRDALQAAMNAAKIDDNLPTRPSVEVTFHAMLLSECDVAYIGHTHPVAVNQIMCSARAEAFAANRLFPDEVVLCGPESVFVEYEDPGLPLAVIMRERVRAYIAKHNEAPKVILLKNHGLIALGQTPTEVLNITAMAVKAAAIFVGACAVGGPVFMSPEDVMHIYKRPDEIYRRQQFVD